MSVNSRKAKPTSLIRRSLVRPETLEQRAVLAASIGDFVWDDFNTNGIQDVGEPGVAGVTVQLLSSTNAVLQTTTTNGAGAYSFSGLAAGNYAISAVAPIGYGFSPTNQGTNDNLDSDYFVFQNRTATFALGASDDFSIDIGLSKKFTIDIPDVTIVSSATGATTGFVDVVIKNVPGVPFSDAISAYNAGVVLTPVPGGSSGVNLIHTPLVSAENPLFPSQTPRNFTTSGSLLLIADNLTAENAENSVANELGIFRIQFTIPANATGDYQLTFDPGNTLFFDAKSNQLTNIDLSPGTVHLVPDVSITATTVSANEGSAGAGTRSFAVTLSHASTQAISVLVNTVDGSATAADGDYTAIVDQLVQFAPGQLTQTVTVAINGDSKVEADESFSVALSAPVNVQLAASSAATTTLVNDDNAILTVSSQSVAEGNSASAGSVFTITLSNAVDTAVSVTVNTANGTAVLGSDFTSTSQVLTFAPGVLTQTYTVGITGDTIVELDETFSVGLSALSASGRSVTTGAAGIGTIQNDDSATLTVSSQSVAEGNSASAGSVFTVTLSNAVDTAVSVTVNTADGTAVLGTDFSSTSQVLTFAPGVLTQTYTVGVTGDTIVELDETFSVGLSALSAGGRNVMIVAAGIGTIQNDDNAILTVSSQSVAEGNSASAGSVFTVTLSNAVDTAVSVTVNTANGTAVLGSDFTSTSQVLTFASGVLTQTYTVGVTGDLAIEPDETFTVNLSNLVVPLGYNVTLGAAGTGTIVNDDFDLIGPRITGVYLSSSTWNPAFLTRLGSPLGFRLETGSDQLNDLPWVNLNRISITFNEDVVIDATDFMMHGVNTGTYTTLFSYDDISHTATWSFSELDRDKLLIQLSANASTGVKDIYGNPLDGNSATNDSAHAAFPTGDGVNGGNFAFRFDVLPGNVDRGNPADTIGVFGNDITRVRDAQFLNSTHPDYSVFYDVTGDGIIFANDVTSIRDRQFGNLPSGEPTGGSFLTASGSGPEAFWAEVFQDVDVSTQPEPESILQTIVSSLVTETPPVVDAPSIATVSPVAVSAPLEAKPTLKIVTAPANASPRTLFWYLLGQSADTTVDITGSNGLLKRRTVNFK